MADTDTIERTTTTRVQVANLPPADGGTDTHRLAKTGGPGSSGLGLGVVLALFGWALLLIGRRRTHVRTQVRGPC